jgi:hypothetical protein
MNFCKLTSSQKYRRLDCGYYVSGESSLDTECTTHFVEFLLHVTKKYTKYLLIFISGAWVRVVVKALR